MSERIRAHDWAATPLGPAERWPQSLRTAVDMMVAMPGPATILWGRHGTQIYNDAYVGIARHRHPALLGRPVAEGWPDAYGTAIAPLLDAARAGRATRLTDISVPLKGHDGQVEDRVFDTDWSPIRDESGTVAGALQTLVETTGRSEALTAIRESEARHRLLVGSWAQAVWETDPAGVVVADSPSWRAYTGQTLGEWLGYGWLGAIHPGDRAFAERQWRDATAARGPVNAEFRLRAPDGGWRWTNVRAAPLLDEAGNIDKWVGMNIDIHDRKSAEAALRESEERYRAVFESIDEGFVEMEMIMGDAGQIIDWRWIDFNPAFERMSGLKGKKGQLFSEVVPELEPEWAQRYGHVIATGETLRFELPVGGLDSWFDAFVSRVGGEGSRRLVVVFNNITARKRAEEALRESEERQAFLLTLSDALRTELDPDRVAERALSLLHGKLGLDRTYIARIRGAAHPVEIVAELGRDDLPPMPAELQPADFPKGFEKAAEGLLVVNDIGERPDLTELDRRSLDAIGLTAFVVAPLHRGAEGMIWAMVAGARQPRVWTAGEASLVQETAERTWSAMERARAEAALRESEERFAQFAGASAAGLWIRDADTLAMEFASPAALDIYGAERAALMDGVETWAAMVVPDDREKALRSLAQAKAGEAVVHEFRIQRPVDGTFRWIRSTDFPLDRNGRVQRIGGIAEDVTEQKLLTEHQGILLAELQHRVRNIMAIIRSIVARTAGGTASTAEYVDLLSGRLLTLARVQALLTRAANADVGLFAIVHDELAAQATHAGQFAIAGPDVALSPKAAETMTLAVHELTTNALKYGALSSPSGTVEVRWEVVEKRGASWLSFDWVESGAPMRETTDKPRRTGFGSELIEGRVPYELGGRGSLSIEAGGARCHLEFPLKRGASVLETDAPKRATVFGGAIDMSGQADLTGQRVLVVEDDYYLATDAARALRGAGAEVIGPCATEAAAREELAENPATCAVLDINLDGGRSFDLARELKRNAVSFVFITGYDQEVIPEDLADVPRLQKPVQFREIVGALADVLGIAGAG